MVNALGKITIHVTFLITNADEAKRLFHDGVPVWTWCASGMNNWVEYRFTRTDALAYLVPEEPLDLPPDAEEFLPEDDDASAGEGQCLSQ